MKKNLFYLAVLLLGYGSMSFCVDDAAADFNGEMKSADLDYQRKRENLDSRAEKEQVSNYQEELTRIHEEHARNVKAAHDKYMQRTGRQAPVYAPEVPRSLDLGGSPYAPADRRGYGQPVGGQPVTMGQPMPVTAMGDAVGARRIVQPYEQGGYGFRADDFDRRQADEEANARRAQEEEANRQRIQAEAQRKAEEEARNQGDVEQLLSDVAGTSRVTTDMLNGGGEKVEKMVSDKAKMIKTRLDSNPELKKYLKSKEGKAYLKERLKRGDVSQDDVKSVEKALNKFGLGKKIAIGLAVAVASIIALDIMGSN